MSEYAMLRGVLLNDAVCVRRSQHRWSFFETSEAKRALPLAHPVWEPRFASLLLGAWHDGDWRFIEMIALADTRQSWFAAVSLEFDAWDQWHEETIARPDRWLKEATAALASVWMKHIKQEPYRKESWYRQKYYDWELEERRDERALERRQANHQAELLRGSGSQLIPPVVYSRFGESRFAESNIYVQIYQHP